MLVQIHERTEIIGTIQSLVVLAHRHYQYYHEFELIKKKIIVFFMDTKKRGRLK